MRDDSRSLASLSVWEASSGSCWLHPSPTSIRTKAPLALSSPFHRISPPLGTRKPTPCLGAPSKGAAHHSQMCTTFLAAVPGSPWPALEVFPQPSGPAERKAVTPTPKSSCFSDWKYFSLWSVHFLCGLQHTALCTLTLVKDSLCLAPFWHLPLKQPRSVLFHVVPKSIP